MRSLWDSSSFLSFLWCSTFPSMRCPTASSVRGLESGYFPHATRSNLRHYLSISFDAGLILYNVQLVASTTTPSDIGALLDYL